MKIRDGKTIQRVFVTVDDAARFVEEIERQQGRFIPTRLPLTRGQRITLSLRLPEASLLLELPVTVLGRRAPRGARASLFAGVFVRVADERHPVLEVLRELASGKVVDLEACLRERTRIPVDALFSSLEELRDELRTLEEGGAGLFPISQQVAPGDRLTLTAHTPERPTALSFDLLVKGLAHHDGLLACRAVLFDEKSRASVHAFLSSEPPKAQGA